MTRSRRALGNRMIEDRVRCKVGDAVGNKAASMSSQNLTELYRMGDNVQEKVGDKVGDKATFMS